MRASQLPTARRHSSERASPATPAGDDSLVLDRYRIGTRLGAGSFGTVWLGHDERLDREVAVKVLPRQRIMDARFEREARAAARLSHPAIVTLYEAAADDEAAYLVSELVRGPTLDELLQAGRLSDRDIVAIGIALCDALLHAHSRGIVHRDVKPSNVLVPARPPSAAYPAKLTDFGVARVIGGDSLTRTGEIVGTDAYMAPEQAVGREAGAPADLYALALVLYEALTGVNPVSVGARPTARLGAHLPPLRRQRRDLPRELGRGIDLALRPRPRERGTIEELQAALSRALEELSDVPGVVEGPWCPRIPLRSRPPDPGPPDPIPLRPRQPEPDLSPAAEVPWSERGLAAACAALLAGWLSAHLLTAGTVAPAAVALLAAGAVLLLPRLGFGLIALSLIVGSVLQGHLGVAVVVGVAALIPVVVMARSGTAWPLSAGAPALGVLALAGAWPALAARAGSPWRRAGLGFVGWLWLAFGGLLRGSGLYLAVPAGSPARSVWSPSIYETVHHVLAAALGAGVLGAGVVWALAAVVLPKLVGSRSLALDAARVVAWAAILVLSTETIVRAGSGGPAPSTAVIGAVASAVVALAPPLAAAWRSVARSEEPRAGLP